MTNDTTVKPDADYEQMKNFIVEGTVVTHGGKLYYVTKVNRVNFQVIDEKGGRWNLRRTGAVQRAPRQDAWTGEKPNQYTRYMEAVESGLVLGSTVEFINPQTAAKYPGVHVIIGQTGDKFRAAKLGGNANNYVRGFTANQVKVVTGTFNKEA
jgi:hypothetical protein